LATKVIVCPECSQLVSYGRLSCPACGAVLASVEGAARAERPTVVPGLTPPPKLRPDDDTDAVVIMPIGARPDEGPAASQRWSDEGPFDRGAGDPMPEVPDWPGIQDRRSRVRIPGSGLWARRGRRGAPKPGEASLLADLPFDAPASPEGWLIAIGAGLAMIGFLLPWADRLSPTATGYFGSWGLAGPGHGFAFVAAMLTTALAILPTPVPTWLRDRAIAPVLGGVVVGVAWPFLVGVTAPQIGVLVAAVGGLLLVAGGVLSARPTEHGPAGRHEGPSPPV
jgi:hypothetical protein